MDGDRDTVAFVIERNNCPFQKVEELLKDMVRSKTRVTVELDLGDARKVGREALGISIQDPLTVLYMCRMGDE